LGGGGGMMRQCPVRVIFGVCLAVVLAALGRVSLEVVRLDQAQTEARAAARLEENVRLALWRMESMLLPLIAQESARPYFSYSAFYPAERAYTRMFAELRPEDAPVASPLLASTSPHVLLHFQIEPNGRITSPQAPEGRMRELAVTGSTTRDRIQQAELSLARLQPSLNAKTLWAALPLTPWAPGRGSPLGQANAAGPRPTVEGSIERSKRVSAYELAAGSNWVSKT